MSKSCRNSFLTLTLSIFCGLWVTPDVRGQVLQRAIGGVLIDAQGTVRLASSESLGQQAEALRSTLGAEPASFHGANGIRAVSLRKLEETLRNLPPNAPRPPEIQYLGGLQRVDAIVVSPDQRDILLYGPGEAWTVHPSGDMVGRRSGKPVLLLDDLLVAWRAVRQNRQSLITCSIDPTPSGRQAVQNLLKSVRQFDQAVLPRVEQALGNQVVTIEGVPTDTHFAAVLAAADFQMKRYAMNLQRAPVAAIPGFLDLVQRQRSVPKDLMPRWWLAVDFPVPACTEDRLHWSLGDSRVKVLTEDELVQADGSVQGTGRSNPQAKRWAELFTEHFEQVAAADLLFARLQQVMDWALIVALIEHHDLCALADCDLPLLNRPDSPMHTERWTTPATVPTSTSFVRVGRQFVITASGGVEIDPWAVVDQPQRVSSIPTAQKAATQSIAAWCALVE